MILVNKTYKGKQKFGLVTGIIQEVDVYEYSFQCKKCNRIIVLQDTWNRDLSSDDYKVLIDPDKYCCRESTLMNFTKTRRPSVDYRFSEEDYYSDHDYRVDELEMKMRMDDPEDPCNYMMGRE